MENQESKVKKMIPAAILVVILAAVAGYFIFGGSKVLNKVSTVAGVATVNGTVIPKTDYDTQLASVVASYKSQGVDITTDATKFPQIKTQILDNLINNELLLQGATAAGIKTSAADVEKQYQTILTQNGGAAGLKTALTQNNLTEAQLRENITKQLTVQTYLLANIDVKSVTATDLEVSQFYADYSKAQKTASSTAKVPALKNLSAQIKQQLLSNKEQTLIANFIAALRQKAKIEKVAL
jgi:hypothetical protein